MSKTKQCGIVTVVILLLIVGVVAWMLWPNQRASATDNAPVARRTDAGYATSTTCVSCHPDQHASWHDSYHRTMTQVADRDTVVAPFDTELRTDSQTARLSRQGEAFWVNMVDQAWEKSQFDLWAQARANGTDAPVMTSGAPRVDAEVVMTTGSHHFQAYWVKGKEGCELHQFPWRYHIAEKRWVHRKDVFLTPPEWQPGMWFRVWNKQCIYCHSTGPFPGEDIETGVMKDTKIAELGIACEACHGPADEHIVFHSRSSDKPATAANSVDPIVNPAKLDHKKSSQICGSCHSHFTHRDPLLSVEGPKFRPGDNLFHFGSLESPPAKPQIMSRFWGDGANRSGGREFSGMSTSECYRQGELSCLSCHSLHESEPNDQLSEAGKNNEACLACHERFRDTEHLTLHTHHAADSSGSECYNCHMPHTNYALFKAIRSHRIDVPQVVSVKSNSRPNACNLCHLDQTLQWTADHLNDWYSMTSPELTFDDKYISAGVLWALKGDAGQRVIAAWHYGWNAAREASGTEWMVPVIAQLMKDPYAAVRWVAFDALKRDESFRSFKFDFDGALSDRESVVDEVLNKWKANRPAAGQLNPRWTRVLLDQQGLSNKEAIQSVLSDRDQRMVAGVE